VVLGLLHGPAELLPVSSSAHTVLVPWILRWDYGELDPELRKTFEVALHAGTAAGSLIILRADLLRRPSLQLAALLGLATAPAAVAGYALERPIERRLGTPRTIAAGLLAGGVALIAADRVPQRRRSADANARDALWLGVAQALALVPGVSRTGATLTAARLRGFTQEDASRLSRHMALPVIWGASALKASRLRRLPPGAGAALAAGAVAAFASTLVSARLVRALDRAGSLAPYAAYRIALAAGVLARGGQSQSLTGSIWRSHAILACNPQPLTRPSRALRSKRPRA
jgi:undecaprenyl-diphosphatase